MKAIVFVCGLLLNHVIATTVSAQDQPTTRVTSTVRLIERIKPSVVAIFTPKGCGSGTIIDPQGFILTNHHVVQGLDGYVLLADRSVLPYRFVGSVPERDIAVVQTLSKKPLSAIKLGRSHDLLDGEPILVAGNPGGRGTVFSSGIVSSRDMMADAPNALVMTAFPDTRRDRFIQYDAASNPGNSGGGLVNVDGFQVGVVAIKFNGENVSAAIPIDRARSMIASSIAAEPRSDVWAGLTFDPLAELAIVTDVAKDSPAEKMDIRIGDEITRWNDEPLESGIQWEMRMFLAKAGDAIALKWKRGEVTKSGVLNLEHFPVPEPVELDDLEPGLNYKTYHFEKIVQLPDFEKLKPQSEGKCDGLRTVELSPDRLEYFGLVFEGYLRIDRPGLYRLVIASDDGSKFYLNSKLMIDNDGHHPKYDRSAITRLDKGLMPCRIEYLEATGAHSLEMRVEELKTGASWSLEGHWFRKAISAK